MDVRQRLSILTYSVKRPTPNTVVLGTATASDDPLLLDTCLRWTTIVGEAEASTRSCPVLTGAEAQSKGQPKRQCPDLLLICPTPDCSFEYMEPRLPEKKSNFSHVNTSKIKYLKNNILVCLPLTILALKTLTYYLKNLHLSSPLRNPSLSVLLSMKICRLHNSFRYPFNTTIYAPQPTSKYGPACHITRLSHCRPI